VSRRALASVRESPEGFVDPFESGLVDVFESGFSRFDPQAPMTSAVTTSTIAQVSRRTRLCRTMIEILLVE
jgi:hypothetical protein